MATKKHRKSVVPWVLGLCAGVQLVVVASASGQSTDASRVTAIEAVEVTAEKKTSTEQKTPITMSVYTKTDLEKLDVHDVSSLSNVAPDLNINTTPAGSYITMRGSSSQDTSEIGDPSVAVGIDGIYLNRPYSLGAVLYDLERIEVLHGPQGTLNGRNSIGGSVNIVTAKPTTKQEGDVTFNVGDYGAMNVNGMYNMPLGPRTQLRLAFSSRRHDGYRNNAPSADSDDEDSKSVRATLSFQPTERFDGYVQLESTHLGGVGDQAKNIAFGYDGNGNVLHSMPEGARSGVHTYSVYTDGNQDVSEKALRYQFNYDLGWSKLTYVGGYDRTDFHRISDSSSNVESPLYWIANQHPRTLNQELRLSSADASRLTWQTGMYYFEEKSSLYSYNAAPTSVSQYTQEYTSDYDMEARSLAGFGQVGFAVTPDFRLSVGARYNVDHKSRSGQNLYVSSYDTLPYTLVTSPSPSTADKWSRTTYHFGADWNVTAKSMLYFKFDTGYKPGGFTTNNSYGPETVKSFEVGAKNRFLHDRLQFNIGLFHAKDEGQQVTQTIETENGGDASVVYNAGISKLWGVEPSLVAFVPVLGRVNLSIQYLHAMYQDFLVSIDGVNTQLAGNVPPQSPRTTVGLGIEHTWFIPSGTLVGSLDSKYQSSQYMTYLNYGDDYQKAYSMTSVSLAYTPESGRYTLSGFVRNLEDSTVFTNATENTYAGSYSYYYMPPRTYGVSLTARF